MAQIKLLSNQTRAALRPPLLIKLASAGVLAQLLPVIKKPAQKSFDSHQRAPKSDVGPKPAPAKPQGAPSPGSGPPARPQSPLHNPSSAGGSTQSPRSGFQPPRSPSTRPAGTGPASPGEPKPAPQQPGINGKSGLQPAVNGTTKNGFSHTSQLFRPEDYPPARSSRMADPRDRFRPKPAQPARTLPETPRGQPSEPPPPAQNNRPLTTEHRAPATPTPPRPARQPGDPLANMRRLLEEHDDLPAQSAVLGVSSDSYPVLLDLNDPAPGAVVVIGDEREVQLDLLRGVVASVAMRNTPRSVQILIVSVDPLSWKKWIGAQGYDRFCLSIEGADDMDALREWILRLGDWTEQRRLGQRSGPPVLMVMDTLSFLPRLAYDVRLNFEWMAKEGPPAQIWPIAAISTELGQLLNSRRMLRAFQTRILGHAEDPSFYVQLAGLSEQEAAGFIRAGRFAVRLGENWLEFGLPGSD